MNQANNIPEQLEDLGRFLRSRPNLADKVLDGIAALPMIEMPPAGVALAAPARRRVRSFVALALATTALVIFALAIWPSRPAITLAQVAAAVNAKPWIHGRSNKNVEIWVSNEHQIYARRHVAGFIHFIDGRQKVQYEFNSAQWTPGGSQLASAGGSLTKSPLGSEWDFEQNPFQVISPDGQRIGQGLFGNSGFQRIISQERHVVQENGQTWLEFRLLMSAGQTIWILRVDPRTCLPVSMCSQSQDDSRSEYQFDYPSDGPSDIFALGIPREESNIKIIDLMPAPGLADALAGMSASRRALGDFKLYVYQLAMNQRREEATVVYRKGDKWRVDGCLDAVNFSPSEQPPPGPERDAWWARSFARWQAIFRYYCDGTRVWVSHQSNYADPSTLVWKPDTYRGPAALFGQGAQLPYGLDFVGKVYRDLTPQSDNRLEFDPAPAGGPPGCVLCKTSSRLATKDVVFTWFYLDPKFGYAVVRRESCEVPPSAISKVPLDAPKCYVSQRADFQRSPAGFWYPGSISEEVVTTDPATGERNHQPEEQTFYHFDFSAPVNDQLFQFDQTTFTTKSK